MDISLTEQKKALRASSAKARTAAHQSLQDHAPLALVARGFPLEATRTRNIVSGFYPYKNEIDVRPLLGKLAGEGWTTCLPIVISAGEALIFRRWLPGEPTIPGIWDIPRPLDDAPLLQPQVLLVPMMAFDRKGHRLGYGGGFYDRTLATLRATGKAIAIGVAFAAQEVAAVPHGPQDQKLDFVLTERELFACA